ncbi:hypothetical protein HAX54_000042, partial [Datura stramonium]|nr:hypothetical protein [Datura stramonium]
RVASVAELQRIRKQATLRDEGHDAEALLPDEPRVATFFAERQRSCKSGSSPCGAPRCGARKARHG